MSKRKFTETINQKNNNNFKKLKSTQEEIKEEVVEEEKSTTFEFDQLLSKFQEYTSNVSQTFQNYFHLEGFNDVIISLINRPNQFVQERNRPGMYELLSFLTTWMEITCKTLHKLVDNTTSIADEIQWLRECFPSTIHTCLDLSGNVFGNTGMKLLSKALKVEKLIQSSHPHYRLTHLNLHESNIGIKGVRLLAEAIEQYQNLKWLDLGDNRIHNDGLKTLVQILQFDRNLTYLDLSENNIRKKEGGKLVAQLLKKNQTLRRLVLDGNFLGAIGAQLIAISLHKNSTLTCLELSDNFIKDKGAKCISQAIKNNHTLRKLTLRNNSIHEKGIQMILEALETNHTLLNLGWETFKSSISLNYNNSLYSKSITYCQGNTFETPNFRLISFCKWYQVCSHKKFFENMSAANLDSLTISRLKFTIENYISNHYLYLIGVSKSQPNWRLPTILLKQLLFPFLGHDSLWINHENEVSIMEQFFLGNDSEFSRPGGTLIPLIRSYLSKIQWNFKRC